MKTRLVVFCVILFVGCDVGVKTSHSVAQKTENNPISPQLVSLTSLYILAWNVESGGADDRLQIIFNKDRFDLIRKQELDRYRDFILNDGNHRTPLLIHLKDKSSGMEFQVVANHLARRDEELRGKQAIGLREWARDQTLPTISIGDFNFDYDFPTQKGNPAFVEMRRDNIWKWIKPGQLVDTNWADTNKDGKDDFPDSMLDFAFVAGPAKNWKSTCKVIVRDGDFPDDDKRSDHRPIELMCHF